MLDRNTQEECKPVFLSKRQLELIIDALSTYEEQLYPSVKADDCESLNEVLTDFKETQFNN